MAEDPFRPKGPFPLWLDAFEEDTDDWQDDALKMCYLRLLAHMRRQGGWIKNDPAYLCEKMRLPRTKGYRKRLSKVLSKLHSTDEKPGFLSQKRILRDLERSRDISEKRSKVAKKRWNNDDAIAFSFACVAGAGANKQETKAKLGEPQSDVLESAEEKFWRLATAAENKHGVGRALCGQLANLLNGDFRHAVDVLERAAKAKDPRRYLAGAVRRIQQEQETVTNLDARRPAGEPDFIAQCRMEGCQIRKLRNDRWKVDSGVYTGEGKFVGY